MGNILGPRTSVPQTFSSRIKVSSRTRSKKHFHIGNQAIYTAKLPSDRLSYITSSPSSQHIKTSNHVFRLPHNQNACPPSITAASLPRPTAFPSSSSSAQV